jgi:hypothetical protein
MQHDTNVRILYATWHKHSYIDRFWHRLWKLVFQKPFQILSHFKHLSNHILFDILHLNCFFITPTDFRSSTNHPVSRQHSNCTLLSYQNSWSALFIWQLICSAYMNITRVLVRVNNSQIILLYHPVISYVSRKGKRQGCTKYAACTFVLFSPCIVTVFHLLVPTNAHIMLIYFTFSGCYMFRLFAILRA